MRKYGTKVIAMILIVAIWLVGTGFLNTNFIENGGNNLRLYSETCPQEVVEYAMNEYERFVYGAISSGGMSYGDSVELGTPFTIATTEQDAQVYFFPIFSDNSIVATFRVCEDVVSSTQTSESCYTGILSKYLVDDLNTLWHDIESGQIVSLYVDANDNLRVQVGVQNTGNNLERNNSFGVINVCNVLSRLDLSENQTRSYTANNLNLAITETQPSGYDWCAAYATASILRYLRSSTTPTAQTLMGFFHSPPMPEDRMSRQQVVYAARVYGYDPVLIASGLTSTQVFAEIDAGRPIYAGMVRYDTDGSVAGRHAIVIRGYNKTTDTYSIWNPWRNYFETMDMDTHQYVASSTRTYIWEATVYGW